MSEELKPCDCREKKVHNAHCCSSCGCKYGDPYCPVDDGIKCQDCNEDDAAIEFIDCTCEHRELTQDEALALQSALKNSAKLIKRPITKADAEAYCRDNGLTMVPVDPDPLRVRALFAEMCSNDDVDDENLGLEFLIAAYKIQGI